MWQKKYRFRLILGSILFGTIMFGQEFYNNGNWNLQGLLWIVYGSVSFGILFHVLFSLLIKKKNKNSKDQKRTYKDKR